MQSRLYRFEIVCALSNVVFQATDPGDGSTVFLYEWTPAPADRAAAKKRLEEVSGELNCQVFTVDASLYIAAVSQELGHDALDVLRGHGLFPGTWLGDPPPTSPPPPPPVVPLPKVKETAPHPPTRPRRWGLILSTIVIASLVAYFVGLGFGKRAAESSYQEQISEQSQTMADQQKQFQNQLGAQSQTAQGASLALSTYAGTQLIRMKNECTSTVRVAVSYANFNGEEVVQGWTAIDPGQTVVLGASPSADFAYYAESPTLSLEWEENSGNAISLVPGNFLYLASAGLAGDAVRQVYPRHGHINGPGEGETLTCAK